MSSMENIQEQTASVLGTSNTQLTQAISKVIDESGGMDGVVKKFKDKGLGDVVDSWISSAPNKSVSPEQITYVFGPDLLQRVSSQVGMTQENLSQQLSTYLPLLVDKLSPSGAVPHEGWWSRTIDKTKDILGIKH